MNDKITQDCSVLWMDLTSQITADERSQFQAAGLNLIPVQAIADLRSALESANLVVVRLTRDISFLEEILRVFRGLGVQLPVICRVDRHRLEVGIQAMRAGAAHVVASDDFSLQTWRPLSLQIAHSFGSVKSQGQAYVFVDPVSVKLLELCRRVASAGVTTLLTGPTGAGKEVLARVLHDASPRSGGPFVALNCAAIPESMVEDLLFGHEKGAFTGANREHRGVFEQAQGGSLFLDEIAEMPYALQAKLLRVLQERQVTRLGAHAAISVDVRLIAATNMDLQKAIQARQFREDLYFRISTFRLRIPPLCERKKDILPLARHLLEVHGTDIRPKELSLEAESMLLGHEWPGNVRELSNVMQRALVLCNETEVCAEHLLFDYPKPCLSWSASLLGESTGSFEDAKEDCAISLAGEDNELESAIRASEHRVIEAALRTAPNRIEAAKVLGISPRTLRYKLAHLRDHGLPIAAAK